MRYGPFYRAENSGSQSRADTQQQIESGEIWGKAARNIYQSDIPCVKAFKGLLPPGTDGLEFRTDVEPTKGSGGPSEARWYVNSPGVQARTINGEDFAVIPVAVTRTQP